MADLIKIKGGNGAVPTLQDRELAYSITENALYIGTPSGNVRLCGGSDANSMNTQIEGVQSDIATIKNTLKTINSRLDSLGASK